MMDNGSDGPGEIAQSTRYLRSMVGSAFLNVSALLKYRLVPGGLPYATLPVAYMLHYTSQIKRRYSIRIQESTLLRRTKLLACVFMIPDFVLDSTFMGVAHVISPSERLSATVS